MNCRWQERYSAESKDREPNCIRNWGDGSMFPCRHEGKDEERQHREPTEEER